MTQDALSFAHFHYTGSDAEKFLQGQVTVNVAKLNADAFCPTAICNLKGRIQFGLWLKRHSSESIEIIISQDLAEGFAAHIKKFGAFSKATLSPADTIYPTIDQSNIGFSSNIAQQADHFDWQALAIRTGEAWISKDTSELFQPQELRLHQRGGVDYDKGCYLGQEIIARLWFKAKPKHWLHLIQAQGNAPKPAEHLNNDVQVVNSLNTDNGWIALVIAKPDALIDLNVEVLDLPKELNGDVARPQ